jgi:phosphoribosylaminoimidazole-succinocarboxamide synthase
MTKPVIETNIKGLKLKARGKVRDIYDLGKFLLIVATDRISAFDVVLPDPIPGKGEVLTQMSRFWFNRTSAIIANHTTREELSDYVKDKAFADELTSRSMIVKKAKPLPVEAIVRGYISGSAWKEYKASGTVCGERLDSGLLESSKFPETLFTPSTKADIGQHDENIPFEKMVDIVGMEIAERVRASSIRIYEECAAYALKRGIIIADTKFEFGLMDDELIVIDEMLTPDSSRFWPADQYESGRAQPSFDKQFVRDWLEGIKWDKKPPAPRMPDDVISNTALKYKEALDKITH